MLLLASNSPRRRELLSLGDWDFRVQPAEIDESTMPGEAPETYVSRLAQTKARTVAELALPQDIVVAADTTVVYGEEMLGKPTDKAEAELILRRLRGRAHQVFTALAVLRVADGKMLSDLCVIDVPMRNYSDEEMQSYIATGDPLDKAGAYAIQHRGFRPVEHLAGCFANVVGLPLCHLTRTLRRFGVEPAKDIARACQSKLGYQCPIFDLVLSGEY